MWDKKEFDNDVDSLRLLLIKLDSRQLSITVVKIHFPLVPYAKVPRVLWVLLSL